jgi:uncharacterized surface protein with fasciclin (FAS1) repeats
MRKLYAVVALLGLAVLLAVPAFAQERPTIAELLSNDPDARFTTLLSAVEAAGLSDTLSGEGPFTLLAPTNDAIDAGLAVLGMTADDLLANTDTLREILLYHLLPGSFFFRDLTSGPTVDAALEGASVTFNLNGGVLTANGVSILDIDNLASNGIVHVLEDGILIPPGLFPPAHVRVAHFAPDAPAADVYINGEVTDATELAFGSVSEWMEVPLGVASIALAPAGTSLDEAAVGPVDVTLSSGSWTTVAAVGSSENGTLTAQAVSEDFSAIPDGQARITFFHAIEGAPAVDVLTGGTPWVSELAFPGAAEDGSNDGAFTVTEAAGTYDFQVVETGTSTPALLTVPSTELAAGSSYLIAFIGSPDSPNAVVVATDLAAMMTPTEEAAPADTTGSTTTEATAEASPTPGDEVEVTPEATAAP